MSLRILVRTYVEYTHRANKVILAACASYPEPSLTANLGASHESLLDTLRHVYLSDVAWRDRVLAGAMPSLIELARSELYSGSTLCFGIAELEEHWPKVTRSLLSWLESVGDTDLNQVMACRLPSGEDLRLTRAEILLHDLNHGTVHRGQVLSLIRAAGSAPPNIDIFSYYLDRHGTQTVS